MFKTHRFLKRLAAVVAVFSLGIVLAACGQTSGQKKSGQINVVTSTDFYGEVARAVVGDKGTVKSIINKPSVDPHDYEPTPAVAKEVAGADVAVANGIGYDTWMNKLVSHGHDTTFLKVGENVMHKKDGDNPHLWYNPKTMPALANALAAKFGTLQPKNKAYFQKNAQKYIESLKPINAELDQLKATAKKTANKAVYVSEPVFDYAIEAMGFKVGNHGFEEAVENETDPSPKMLTDMHQGLKKRQVAFFVYNKQVTSKTVQNLVAMANENRVPVLKVTETLPAGHDYKSWMLDQYRALNQILK